MTQMLLANPLQVLGTPDRPLRIDAVLALQACQTGWLMVDAGQVWITRSGDAADHVLAAGDALALAPGQRLVVEPWRAGQAARLRWAAGALPQAAVSDVRSRASRTLDTALRHALGRMATTALCGADRLMSTLRISVRPFGG